MLQRKMKEGNVLFHDALNTFYFQFYGTGNMDMSVLNSYLMHGQSRT